MRPNSFRIITNGEFFRVQQLRRFLGFTWWGTEHDRGRVLCWSVAADAQAYIDRELRQTEGWKVVGQAAIAKEAK